jgi:hypothetical protein
MSALYLNRDFEQAPSAMPPSPGFHLGSEFRIR